MNCGYVGSACLQSGVPANAAWQFSGDGGGRVGWRGETYTGA